MLDHSIGLTLFLQASGCWWCASDVEVMGRQQMHVEEKHGRRQHSVADELAKLHQRINDMSTYIRELKTEFMDRLSCADEVMSNLQKILLYVDLEKLLHNVNNIPQRCSSVDPVLVPISLSESLDGVREQCPGPQQYNIADDDEDAASEVCIAEPVAWLHQWLNSGSDQLGVSAKASDDYGRDEVEHHLRHEDLQCGACSEQEHDEEESGSVDLAVETIDLCEEGSVQIDDVDDHDDHDDDSGFHLALVSEHRKVNLGAPRSLFRSVHHAIVNNIGERKMFSKLFPGHHEDAYQVIAIMSCEALQSHWLHRMERSNTSDADAMHEFDELIAKNVYETAMQLSIDMR